MRIAIVDGYSVGAALVTALRRGGARLLHVTAAPTDLIDSPGFAFLVSDDPAAVRRDHDTLREWEAAGLYTS